jgi:hypothetical protein
MNIKGIQTGKRYHLSGDIENGYMNGNPIIDHEEVTRVVTRITDTQIICECGRKFIINDNLKVTER